MSSRRLSHALLTPLGISVHLSGEPVEVAALVTELQGELLADGWQVLDQVEGEPPRCWLSLTRQAETLTVTLSDRPRSQLIQNPMQYELCAAGAVAAEAHSTTCDRFLQLPFTPTEIRRIERDMPLTAAITEQAHRWVPGLSESERHPLRGFAAIFTIHHQTDFIVLLSKALALGIDPRLCTVIDKEYQYLNSSRVDAHIEKQLGIPVYRYSRLVEGIADHVRRVERIRLVDGATTWQPTLIIDDGGYILPVLVEQFEAFLGLFHGAVEQTSSGIWAIRPYLHRIRMPVFSVAESDLKSTVEAQGAAMAGIANLRRLLPQEKFDGRRALVVGFGQIGKALADYLRRLNMGVSVADNDPSKATAARQLGFEVFSSVKDALSKIHFRYVYSCAGPCAVSGEALSVIRRNCYLVSLTSRDYAFDKEWLASECDSRQYGNIGSVYSRTMAGSDVDLFLVADGFPINFHFAESMPNQQSDLIMASLLVGAITLAKADPPWPHGRDRDRANDVLNQGPLLTDFLALDDGNDLGFFT